MLLDTDTHNSAVQASAFRLISLLKTRYSDVVITPEAHGSLLAYLQHKINPLAYPLDLEDVSMAQETPAIASLMKIISAIEVVESLSEEQKKQIFEQMVVFTRLNEEMLDDNQRQWSINCYFDNETKTLKRRLTSPFEAMALVSCAIYDDHNSLEEVSETQRIENFYLELLNLHQQKQASNLEKCSAGLQHDILHLLYGFYLDDNRKPFVWVTDTTAFIHNAFLTFIESALNALEQEERDTQLMLWIRWMTSPQEKEITPILSWLRKRYPSTEEDSEWRKQSHAFIAGELARIGVNPQTWQDSLVGFTSVDLLNSLPIPTFNNSLILLTQELLKRQDYVPPKGAMTQEKLTELYTYANRALEKFKTLFSQLETEQSAAFLSTQKNTITVLFQLLADVEAILMHQVLFLWMDEKVQTLYDKALKLAALLKPALNNFIENIPFSGEILQRLECAHYSYHEAIKGIAGCTHPLFIENFFADLRGDSWEQLWAKLQFFQKEGQLHPLAIEDTVLSAWLTRMRESEPVDITPYDVNRVLLHALIVSPQQWSPLFYQTLHTIISWLSQSAAENAGVNFQFFQKTYPPIFLVNLRWMVCMHNITDENLKQLIHANFINLSLKDKMKVPFVRALFQRGLEEFTAENREQVLQVLISSDTLGDLIESSNGLIQLLTLSLEQLPAEARAHILEALKPKFGDLIPSYSVLRQLLTLAPEQLPAETRVHMIEALKPKFGDLIWSCYELGLLLELPTEQLPAKARVHMIEALKPVFNRLIWRDSGFEALLKLSPEQLPAEARAHILEALKLKVGDLIQSFSQLTGLFKLSPEQLPAEARVHIIQALMPKFGDLIWSCDALAELLELSTEQLPAEARAHIFEAIKSKFGDLILSCSQLTRLFKLSPEQLPAEARVHIIQALKPMFGDFSSSCSVNKELKPKFDDFNWHCYGHELAELLALSTEQLPAEARAHIFEAIKPQLRHLIQSGYEPTRLLELSPEQLPAEVRDQIILAIRTFSDDEEKSSRNKVFSALPSLSFFAENQILQTIDGDKLFDLNKSF